MNKYKKCLILLETQLDDTLSTGKVGSSVFANNNFPKIPSASERQSELEDVARTYRVMAALPNHAAMFG